VDVKLEKETVWLTQKQMAQLFEKDTDTVGLHIRNLYKEKELDQVATTEDSSVVQSEGGRQIKRVIRFYKSHQPEKSVTGLSIDCTDN